MKKILLILIFIVSGLLVKSQSYFQGFENWYSDTVTVLDDYQTSTIESYMNNVMTTTRQNDAVIGSYSIKLEVALTANNDTVFGYFLSGDPDNMSPGQAVALSNVDSLIGYYKSNIQANDSSLVLCSITDNGVQTGGGMFYFKGVQSTWKRFAFAVNAASADSMLIAFAAGDPINDFSGIPGSWIMLDNIFLKSSTGTTSNIVNYSFENWSDESVEIPANWSTTGIYTIGAPISAAKSTTDKHSGNSAIELTTVIIPQWNDTLAGMATNGIFGNNGMGGGEAYTGMPNGIEFYYKYAPVGNDTGFVSIVFKKAGVPFAYAGSSIGGAASSYTHYSSPLNLMMAPDSVLITLYSGDNPGTILKVDDIKFLFPVGENEIVNVMQLVSYPNPATDQINLKFDLKSDSKVCVKLTDVSGKTIEIRELGDLNSGNYYESFNTSNYSAGIYFIELTANNKVIQHKFIKK